MRSRFFFTTVESFTPDADYQAILDYGTLQGYALPSSSQQRKQNQFLIDLKSAGVWSDLDLLYVFATNGDSDFAKINWVNPGTFNATNGVAPTFTQNIGFVGNGTNMYLTTGWAPDPDGVNFTMDEGGAFCKVNNNHSAGAKCAFGVRGTSVSSLEGQLLLMPKDGASQHAFSVNGGATGVGTLEDADGFYHIRRVADNDLRLFKNGSQVGVTQTVASDGLSIYDLFILALDAQGAGPGFYSDAQIAVFGIGASLTGNESSLYTAWNTYFSSL